MASLLDTHFLLGVFAELRKATVSFVMSVCLSVSVRLTTSMLQLGSHWTDFYQILNSSIFENMSKNFKFNNNNNNNNNNNGAWGDSG